MTKESQNIDNILKGALSNYAAEQPAASVWRGISGKLFLHDLVYFNWLNIPYFIPTVSIAAVAILAVLFIGNDPSITPKYDPRDSLAESHLGVTTSEEIADDSSIHPAESNLGLTTSEETADDSSIRPAESNLGLTTSEEGSQQPEGNNQQSAIGDQQSEINNQQSTINNRTAYNALVLSEKTALYNSADDILRPVAYLSISYINITPEPSPEFSLNPYSEVTGARSGKGSFDYYTESQYAVGLHYTPEKMFNSPEDKNDKNIFSIDLSLTYKMDKYIFQTGIGYSYFENDYNYDVNYIDFLGTYTDMVTVTFSFDSVNGVPIPDYTWKTTEVFDTTDQALTSRVTNFYSALQLPLLIGYKVFEKKKFSIFVKGGPLLSFLVYKNEPGATYYSPDKKVTSIDYTNPSRTKVNWQFMGSVGLGYQFTQRFGLAVEPTIKYYFNEVYGRNKSADTRPYTFGVRTGIIYTIK